MKETSSDESVDLAWFDECALGCTEIDQSLIWYL
jgi:hypothetical protein